MCLVGRGMRFVKESFGWACGDERRVELWDGGWVC